MSIPIWLTPAGDLGIIPEEEYYEFNFDSYVVGGGTPIYSLVAGRLPNGLEIKSDGTMAGMPLGSIGGVPSASNKITTSTFTLRITSPSLEVADRTFSLTIAGILPQIITPASANLGSYIDGTFISIDINTIESNSFLTSTFSIIDGELPPGVTLDSTTGIISGYIRPFISDQTAANTGYDNSQFDEYLFDFTGTSTSKNYQFTIKADNGITVDTKIYTIYVFALSSITADSTLITADSDSLITADSAAPKHTPVILDTSGLIGRVRQDTNVNIKINGIDFDDDTIDYAIASGSLPSGLTLNTASGWISGLVPSGSLGTATYNFSVVVYKRNYPIYVSSPKSFSIRVLGQISNDVEWITPVDLGTIFAGQVSELFVEAETQSGRYLNYRLDNSFGTLPPGLKLLDNGLISGRITFDTFMLDSGTTTFDSGTTFFDRVYNFTVAVYDANNFVYSTRTFTLTVLAPIIEPYENLYIQILPDIDQRNSYSSLIDNTDIFPQDYLYRSNDPWFGKNTTRRSLFLAGLKPREAAIYAQSMTFNHYWKTLRFGGIKTARAVDSNFNTKYEVVYAEIIDEQVNIEGLGPNLAVSLPTNSQNITTIYPNSFPNMEQRIVSGVGYSNRGVLPDWMTSRQEDGTVLGFKRVLILCYTVPGKGKEVAYRVKQNINLLNRVDFTIDRYLWDSSMSASYNKVANTFISNNFVLGTGTINANTNSNIIVGLTLTINGAGTISAPLGNTIINGTGTSFATELRAGRALFRSDTGEELGDILRIINSETLIIDTPLANTLSAVSYSSISSKTIFSNEIYVNDTIIVNTNVKVGTVKSINSDSNITLYTNALVTVSNVSFLHNYREQYKEPGDGDKYLKYPQVGVIS
jgi:hypothetical protein